MATRRTRLASAGDGCETGQFIIRLVRPHASCKIDPDHLLTVLVNGNDLRHVLGYWNMSSIYSEIGSHAPFVQPVTKTQLDNMLMTTRMLTDGMPTFPELPSPFDLFRVTMSMGLTHSPRRVPLPQGRGAQNWAHHRRSGQHPTWGAGGANTNRHSARAAGGPTERGVSKSEGGVGRCRALARGRGAAGTRTALGHLLADVY